MKTRVFNFASVLFLLLTISACNKEEFYEKGFLETPTDLPTDGGAGGSATGGTAGGSTTGGTTGESTTGGTAGGSTTGGTTGESTTGGTAGGSTTGGTTGSSTGGTSGGSYGDCNNGHGNDPDGLDESNPTVGLEPRCRQEIFQQTSNQSKKLDVIWIIDNSGSMNDEQDALGSNFSAFIDDFIQRDVDFKMAITTTDTSSSSKKGRMVTGSDSKLTSAQAKANQDQFKDDFKALVQVGTSGSGKEKGLEASEGFLEKYGQSFLRTDAYLAVVVISDEEDQSPKSVEAYTNYLKSFKTNPGLIKTYSIVDVTNSNCCQNGITTGSARYKEASSLTGGVVADIQNDFYQVLSDMSGNIISLIDSFALANDPIPGTLRVYVDGVETQNYTYSSQSRSIKFNTGSVPVAGSQIRVTYIK